ncbi:hypothetical protein CLOM_g19481 [Closterium sp. NIES-68]|nr:hypothetical protein CLOM_g19481 [Closterium sp. NIES-68]GJP81975.1 hypothetical protein CLOP_g12100 [Closterium sp. NIES-67]
MASRLALFALLFAVVAISASGKTEKDVTQLQIGVKFKPATCKLKARNLDTVRVHYKGMLTDGTVFDSSYDRSDPIQFRLGQGNVIKGWDIGILGMCVGEKRKLKIPSHMGYGESGSPPKIPGGATLIFETELVEIVGAAPDEEEL